ncbi:rhoptry ROP9 [Babesia ovis]|uniref:Rhoptry ROP9 n=1 Tax=Babesia ovis TaxID=5869 RepID=A0A9W5TAL8_BABOV|nr:rhoptry ROP9 [Babesia ovis]
MATKLGAKIYRDGIVANGVELVMRKWIKSREDMGSIFADNSTVFAHVAALIDSKDTEQCRNMLKLGANVDMAVICVVTAVNTYAGKGGNVTVWMCSDLKETTLKVNVYGTMSSELGGIGQGSIIAVLNPDLTDYTKDNYRGISVKNCDNVLLIGEIDGLQMCKGVTTKGTTCKNLVYKHHQGEFCKYHLKAAFDKPKAKKTSVIPKSEDIIKQVDGTIQRRELDENDKQNFIFRPTAPSDPTKVMSTLGGLGSLLNKVTETRIGTTNIMGVKLPVMTTAPPEKCRVNNDKNRNKEFDSAVNSLKNIITPDHKNNKKVLGLLQLIAKYVNYVDKECIQKSGILQICSSLFDHPLDGIAIESLKLRRVIKKYMQTPLKDNAAPTYLIGRKKEDVKQHIKNQATSKDLETILAASSDVDAYVEKENIETTKRKLEALERMNKAQEYQKTVTEIEVVATYCHECKRWSEYPNPPGVATGTILSTDRNPHGALDVNNLHLLPKRARFTILGKIISFQTRYCWIVTLAPRGLYVPMNNNVESFNAAMRDCIANRVFHGITPEEAADKFVTMLEENGIKYIASDFDATMISKHSGGYCDPKSDIAVLSSVTEHFKAVAERIKRTNIKLCIVTFSDDSHVKDHPVYISGGRMVKKALEHSKCTADIQKVYDFYPRFWESPSQYKKLGLKGPMPNYKEYHLRQICADFNVELGEIILLDDDIYNCKNAKKIGAAVLHRSRYGSLLAAVFAAMRLALDPKGNLEVI